MGDNKCRRGDQPLIVWILSEIFLTKSNDDSFNVKLLHKTKVIHLIVSMETKYYLIALTFRCDAGDTHQNENKIVNQPAEGATDKQILNKRLHLKSTPRLL